MLFLFGKLLADTASVAEFLLVTGGTDAAFTGIPVILQCAAKGNFTVFFFHEDHTPLIVRLMIKPAVNIVRLNDIYKGSRVKFLYFFNENLCFFT